MNTLLAHDIPTPVRWRLGVWATRAWQRMGWRHVLLALALWIARDLFGPLGGAVFMPSEQPGFELFTLYLNGEWAFDGLSMIYCVLVADEAFEDGVPAPWAYGLAVIAMATFVSAGDRLMGFTWGQAAPAIAYWTVCTLFQGGLVVSIYAYWRVTKRTLRRAQAAETERVRNEQRVQTAKLLALQSRVEPQMLFDALGRVAELHIADPQAADALLADLIALLRAMQPGGKSDNSTVEREFALVEAWLRVTRSVAHGAAPVQLRITPEALSIGIAPMLVLPLVRAVLAVPRATQLEWGLSAHVAGNRLAVTLQSTADTGAAAAGLLTSIDLAALRDRLGQLFGRSASLVMSPQPPVLALELPRLQEDPDDDRADR
jgi:Histidine kinase